MANEAFLKGNKCWGCKFEEKVPGSEHSSCNHPVVEAVKANKLLDAMSVFASIGRVPNFLFHFKELNLIVDPVGIKNGWFIFPFNFDPTWLDSCDGWKEKAIDISDLPRIKEQENGNTIMWFESIDGKYVISYGKVPSGGYSIRVSTPKDKYEIPAKEGLTESEVRRAIRNTISTRGEIKELVERIEEE